MSKNTKFHDVADEDEVGFCKPPKSGQFKKGQSGNPKGRKPKTDFKKCNDPMLEMLFEDLTLPIKGKPVTKPSILWMLISMRNNAVKGCHRSFKILMDSLGDRGLKGLWQILKEETGERSQAEMDEAMRWLNKAMEEIEHAK
jgi:uncharacterized protein DUF5681